MIECEEAPKRPKEEHMKTKGVRTRVRVDRVYTAQHLKRYYPAAFEKALEKYRENIDLDYTSDELMSSLKGLCGAANVKMRDWSLGAYNRGNNLSVTMPGDDGTAELTGGRALAWIENNVLAQYRAPYGLPKLAAGAPLPKGYTRGWIAPCKDHPNGAVTCTDDNPIRRWAAPGHVSECPFTGMCYDMDFLEDLKKSIVGGRTLKEAFEDLADVFARTLESEYEYQSEPAQFLDAAEVNQWEFDKHGRMV